MSTFTATLVCGPADGVSAAILLTVGGKRGKQYMFNVPEGWARLALEGKVIPGPRCTAGFITSLRPESCGGLPGLILRMRTDGHDQFRMVGPPGLVPLVQSYVHLFKWRHPQLLLDPWQPSACRAGIQYEDDLVSVVPILAHDELSPHLPWLKAPKACPQPGVTPSHPGKKSLQGGSAATTLSGTVELKKPPGACEDSCTQEGRACTRTQHQAPVNRERSLGTEKVETRCKQDGSCREASGASSREQEGVGGMSSGRARSDGSQGGCSDGVTSDEESEETDSDEESSDESSSGEDSTTEGSLSEEESSSESSSGGESASDHKNINAELKGVSGARTGNRLHGAASVDVWGLVGSGGVPVYVRQGSPTMTTQQHMLNPAGGRINSSNRSILNGQSAGNLPKSVEGIRQTPLLADSPLTGFNSRGGGLADTNAYKAASYASTRVPGNHPRQSHGLPKRTDSASGTAGVDREEARGTGEERQQERRDVEGACSSAWGFIVRVKQTGQLLGIVDCPDAAGLAALPHHPIVQSLLQQPETRVAAVLHLTPQTLSSTEAYRQWTESLPGRQVLLTNPSPAPADLAYRACAKTLIKLNRISPVVFPLPHVLPVACSTVLSAGQHVPHSPSAPTTSLSGPIACSKANPAGKVTTTFESGTLLGSSECTSRGCVQSCVLDTAVPQQSPVSPLQLYSPTSATAAVQGQACGPVLAVGLPCDSGCTSPVGTAAGGAACSVPHAVPCGCGVANEARREGEANGAVWAGPDLAGGLEDKDSRSSMCARVAKIGMVVDDVSGTASGSAVSAEPFLTLSCGSSSPVEITLDRHLCRDALDPGVIQEELLAEHPSLEPLVGALATSPLVTGRPAPILPSGRSRRGPAPLPEPVQATPGLAAAPIRSGGEESTFDSARMGVESPKPQAAPPSGPLDTGRHPALSPYGGGVAAGTSNFVPGDAMRVGPAGTHACFGNGAAVHGAPNGIARFGNGPMAHCAVGNFPRFGNGGVQAPCTTRAIACFGNQGGAACFGNPGGAAWFGNAANGDGSPGGFPNSVPGFGPSAGYAYFGHPPQLPLSPAPSHSNFGNGMMGCGVGSFHASFGNTGMAGPPMWPACASGFQVPFGTGSSGEHFHPHPGYPRESPRQPVFGHPARPAYQQDGPCGAGRYLQGDQGPYGDRTTCFSLGGTGACPPGTPQSSTYYGAQTGRSGPGGVPGTHGDHGTHTQYPSLDAPGGEEAPSKRQKRDGAASAASNNMEAAKELRKLLAVRKPPPVTEGSGADAGGDCHNRQHSPTRQPPERDCDDVMADSRLPGEDREYPKEGPSPPAGGGGQTEKSDGRKLKTGATTSEDCGELLGKGCDSVAGEYSKGLLGGGDSLDVGEASVEVGGKAVEVVGGTKESSDAEREDCVSVQIGSKESAVGCAADVSMWGLPEEAVPACLRAMIANGDPSALLFLGTGASEPMKYRGASSIHLTLPSGRGLLLDAGEGCWGQLVRFYGPHAATSKVEELVGVWISHYHADHCCGLPAILSARSKTSKPLLVVGPDAVGAWLAACSVSHRLVYHFVPCRSFGGAMHTHAQLSSAGVAEWRCVPVIHCRDAWGLVLRLASGFKLVVSGDTRPCRRLAQAGRAATLLIHEATFDDALLSQATEKRHSTMGEAHRAAREMGAYRTVLTHFSQRYGKWLPQVQEEDAFVKERCATAFDGMHVPLILIPWLPSLMPAVVTALSEGGDGEANEAEMAGASG